MLELPFEPVTPDKVRHLTPQLAEIYAGLSEKTLQRDLESLSQAQLIVRTPEGVRANFERILAFLPVQRTSPDSEPSGSSGPSGSPG